MKNRPSLFAAAPYSVHGSPSEPLVPSDQALSSEASPSTPCQNSQHSAAKQPRPSGVWLAKRQRLQVRPRISYVYLLVHRNENRFKIGKSISPKDRLSNLPEAELIDSVRSLQVILPSQQRAGQIESLLHKALAPFRLQHLNWMGQVNPWYEETQISWDGATEWFSLPGLRHALEILKALPGLHGAERTSLQTLEGEPCWFEREGEQLTQRQRRTREAEQYNLGRLDEIHDVLMVLSRRLKTQWLPSNDPASSAGTLRLVGFKTQWEPDMLHSRFGATNSELWELRDDRRVKAGSSPAICPLVRLIAYSKANPTDLELVFNSLDVIRKLPGGEAVCRRWLGFCAGFCA